MGFTTVLDGPGDEGTAGGVVGVGGRRGVVLVAVATDIDDEGNIVLGVIVGSDEDSDDEETRPSELIYEPSVAKSECVGDERSGLGGCTTGNGEEDGNSGWRGEEEFAMSLS